MSILFWQSFECATIEAELEDALILAAFVTGEERILIEGYSLLRQ